MHAQRLPQPPPIADLNTTPLIDVLLVLLILFIITIPAATHSLEVPLPQKPRDDLPINPLSNTVTITPAGATDWNGNPVNEAQLAGLLAATTRLVPEPELRFAPAAQAPYQAAARTLQTIKASRVTGFGFVGNERFSDFGKVANR